MANRNKYKIIQYHTVTVIDEMILDKGLTSYIDTDYVIRYY